jgi:hypothetical protein
MIPSEIKEFIAWKDHPLCPFSVHYNGERPKGHRIYYAQTEKGISLDELYEYWETKVKNKTKP